MKKSRSCYLPTTVLLLLGGFCLLVAGCAGGGSGDGDRQSAGRTETGVHGTVAGVSLNPSMIDPELLSTFRSKDPFIQQNVHVESGTTTTTGSSTTTSGTPGGSVTTQVSPTTSYRPTITSTTGYVPWPPTSTTTTEPPPTTTTTAPHLHTLKILSMNEVGGSPAVTFQVDSSVYKDRRVGDVVSSSWGQIKVLDLSTASKVATLLHGSETLVLSAGQVVYE